MCDARSWVLKKVQHHKVDLNPFHRSQFWLYSCIWKSQRNDRLGLVLGPRQKRHWPIQFNWYLYHFSTSVRPQFELLRLFSLRVDKSCALCRCWFDQFSSLVCQPFKVWNQSRMPVCLSFYPAIEAGSIAWKKYDLKVAWLFFLNASMDIEKIWSKIRH